MAQLVTINVAQLVTIKMAKRGPVSNFTAYIYREGEREMYVRQCNKEHWCAKTSPYLYLSPCGLWVLLLRALVVQKAHAWRQEVY